MLNVEAVLLSLVVVEVLNVGASWLVSIKVCCVSEYFEDMEAVSP